ncbi:pseudaminic acid biosynthesis-associated methylase [Poseidonibacter lekithochrous]|uniref:pseudaminic acid biosynthesis-associated methylase n=1 Tax=Poseidonibacter lekithochrous TaxID=1904463 RepID=UPI0008FCB436|nr:pseudaminic acid biosynthesis-associated methylase [Poseidonibacter lekithochrous]QKJ24481.1 pseudaminic acid biosynthesis-associated methylase [Poseidonibacter lekithochrous]
MSLKTEQEEFWASNEWGSEYIKRNSYDRVKNNINFFSKVLDRTHNINSVIEFGANIGLNLLALNQLLPSAKYSAIEINKEACTSLEKLNFLNTIHNESIFDFECKEKRDLVFTKVVLIHINPEYLDAVYKKLYETSSKYILVAEYYNPTPVEVNYRGHEGKLFKRDFAGELLDKYEDLRLVDYGFAYHRDNNFHQDDISWFLLEKTN